jgi:glycosyltransferase involved in cell wall biosynthesis
MIGNSARYAAGLIVTTKSAERDIRRELLRQSHTRNIGIVAAPLPPSAIFSDDRNLAGPALDEPYFVICGAIEPRKNHLLLLNVWRELHRAYGDATPKLVIVGSRWSKHSDARRFIERASSLAPHVIHVGGLSTPGLANLIAGARALLMPSFAEGFGLPIVEALAARTPVIASNIPAHIEAGGSHATYVSPIDGLGWKAAITDHLHNHEKYRSGVATYNPYRWSDYFRKIQPFLESLSETEAICAAAE